MLSRPCAYRWWVGLLCGLSISLVAQATPGFQDDPAPPVAADSELLQQVRDQASEVALTALGLLGVRYRRGGTSQDVGFDCSGFTRHVVESNLGVTLPRRADDQARAPGLVPVLREQLAVGDLVFFNTLRRTFSHVGIYIGDGRFIHAPRPGGRVRVDDIRYAYWARRFTGGRRVDRAGETRAVEPPVAISPPTLLQIETSIDE